MKKNVLHKGKLLIAEPSILSDSSFNRSIIFLTEHNKEGSVGFIINKPTKYCLQDLIPEINCSFTVYKGGPVEQNNLYFVHKIPELIPESIKIDKNMYWGGNFEVLKELLNNQTIQAEDIRFFLGYSGWSISQLDEEIKESSWIVCNNNYKDLLTENSLTLWKNKLLELGGKYKIWANAPKSPTLN